MLSLCFIFTYTYNHNFFDCRFRVESVFGHFIDCSGQLSPAVSFFFKFTNFFFKSIVTITLILPFVLLKFEKSLALFKTLSFVQLFWATLSFIFSNYFFFLFSVHLLTRFKKNFQVFSDHCFSFCTVRLIVKMFLESEKMDFERLDLNQVYPATHIDLFFYYTDNLISW